MKTNKKTKITPEEEVDGFMYPAALTPEEKEQSDKEMREYRFRLLREMTDEQKKRSALTGLKFRLKNYLQNSGYEENYSFGNIVAEYLRILNLKRKDFAKEIDIHETRLSRIINNNEQPNRQIFYRLEHHSDNVIPAHDWWMVCEKAIEYEIKNDKAARKKEYAHVKKKIHPASAKKNKK